MNAKQFKNAQTINHLIQILAPVVAQSSNIVQPANPSAHHRVNVSASGIHTVLVRKHSTLIPANVNVQSTPHTQAKAPTHVFIPTILAITTVSVFVLIMQTVLVHSSIIVTAVIVNAQLLQIVLVQICTSIKQTVNVSAKNSSLV